MQIYLLHYIWYIFSSATIPIINFRGIVNSENERSFFVYSIRTRVREHTFVWIFWQFRIFNRVYNILYTIYCIRIVCVKFWLSSSRNPCQLTKAAKKLRLGSCKGAALHTQALRKSCALFPLQKSCTFICFVPLRTKFDKKIQIFSRKLQLFKKIIKKFDF